MWIKTKFNEWLNLNLSMKLSFDKKFRVYADNDILKECDSKLQAENLIIKLIKELNKKLI